MKSKVEINRWLVLINSTSTVLTYLLGISVVVWLQQHLLRRVSPEEYAIYPLVSGLVLMLPPITTVLLGGLGRYAVEAYARGDDARLMEIVSSSFPVLAVVSGLLMGLAGLAAWQAETILNIDPRWLNDARLMLLLLTTTLAVRTMLAPFSLGLYIRQKFIGLSLLSLGSQAIRLTLLLFLLNMSTRVLWIAVAATVAEVTTAIAQAIISRSIVPALRFRLSKFRWSALRELVGYGTWNAVCQLAALGRITVQPLILNHFGTPMDVTCFGVGIMIAAEIQRLTTIVTGPLQPPLTAMYATGDHIGLQRAYLRGNRYALWAILLVVVPLIIFSHEAIDLYIGKRYGLAAAVLTCFLGVMPLHYCNIMLNYLLAASGQLRGLALRQILNQSAVLILALVLVKQYQLGALGSALAALAVNSLSAPLMWWPLGRRVSGVRRGDWLRQTVWPGIVPAMAGSVAWLLLWQTVHPTSWLALGICVAIGAACYLAVLLIYCLQPHEREDVKRIWQTIWNLPQIWLRRNDVGIEGVPQDQDDLV